MQYTVYIALGSNIGDRLVYLQQAVTALDKHVHIDVVRVSPVYESEAHTISPEESQQPYLNAVIQVQTLLPPDALLTLCLKLEKKAGREIKRALKWAPRTLDIDILLYKNISEHNDILTIPHPRLGDRKFVLTPLCDINPNLYIPTPFDSTVEKLLEACTDTGSLYATSYKLTTK